MQTCIVTAVWRGAVGVLTVGWEAFGINPADMNEGGICLHLESAQMQGAEKFFQTCELHSPRYKFVIRKVEMRNLLNKIFYKEIIRPD